MAYVLGLDLGITSTIGILIRLPSTVLGVAALPVARQSPGPGRDEDDPAEWWGNVCAMTRQLIVSSNVKSDELAAIGVTGTRSALVLLDAEGQLLRPRLPHNDDRYGPQVAAMLREWNETDFRRKAGNGINQERVGAKLRWIEAHEPDVHAEIATVSGSSDYVNWRLSGERAVEQNWALEAGLVDIETDRIDDALVAFAHCPQNAVPPAIASHRILGCTTPDAATETALPPGVPVVGGASGMIASALSAGIVAPGDVLLKFGSSVEMMVATDRRVPDARFSFDYHLIPGLFMLSRRLQNGGSALDWFATTFACDEAARAEAAGVSFPQHLDALAEKCPPGAEGLVVVPSFLDANTPILDADAGAIFSGLTDGHTLGHLWRALLEGFAYAIAHDIEALRGMGHRTERFFVSDDGASSPIWMRIVADVTQQPLRRIEGRLCSCLGAAFTAAVGAGLTDDWTDAARFVEPVELIMPDAARAGMYGAGYERFRALSGAADPLQ